MAGLFFCLASAGKCRAFIFFHAAIQPHTSIYSVFYIVNATISPTPQNSAQGFAGAFPVDLLHSSAHNTAATQTAYAPSAPRWRAYHQAQYLHRYQIPPPNRDAVQLSTAAYYNKVYKGAPLSWIHARQCSRPQTIPARRLAIWHRVSGQGAPGQSGTLHPAGQSSSRSAAGGAEPLTATAVSLFGLSPDS